MTKFSTMIGLIVSAAVIATPVAAQTVPDNEVPTTSLNIPGNVQLYGDAKPNVYRPSATVNGEIITATDIEQRMALIRIANNNINLPPEEEQRLRALADEIVHAHRDEVEPDGVEASGGRRHQRLRAHAVGGRHEHRLA